MSGRLCLWTSETRKQVHLCTAACWSYKDHLYDHSIQLPIKQWWSHDMPCRMHIITIYNVHTEAMCGACRPMLPSMVAAQAERC